MREQVINDMIAEDVFGIQLFSGSVEGLYRVPVGNAFPQEAFVFRCEINDLHLGPMVNSFILRHELLMTKFDILSKPACQHDTPSTF